MGERIEQRRLSRVGVAHQRDHPERHRLPRAAARGALLAHCFDGVLDFSHAIANAPAVGFKFLLARSARADAAAKPRKFFAASGQPRQQIIELRKLHLELAFAGARVRGEDIENQLGAVDHAAARALFHVAKLHGREIVVHDHQRHVARMRFGANFLELAAPHQRCWIERIAHLQERSCDMRARAVSQLLEFGQGLTCGNESLRILSCAPSFFRLTPTSRTRSRLSKDCAVFIRGKWSRE